jgi:hypothetical protein
MDGTLGLECDTMCELKVAHKVFDEMPNPY